MITSTKVLLDVVKNLRALILPEARELGDVRRNAVLWLARLAKTNASSFGRGLSTAIDPARLDELPYASAVGFAAASGLFSSPLPTETGSALRKLARRSPHTAEKTGYADDVLHASGLLLLGRQAGVADVAARIQAELEAITPDDPLLRAVLAVVVPSRDWEAFAIGSNAAPGLAVAALIGAINEPLARRLFPGATNAEARLVEVLTRGSYEPTADFAGMLILAALESSLAIPDESEPLSIDGDCDIAVLIALKEEFRVFFERIAETHMHLEEEGRSYYRFSAPSRAGEPAYRCVATFIGDMGPNRAGIISEKVLGRWSPSVIAMVGIAGGVHGDVRLGDVVVASQVDNYLEGAKASEDADGMKIQRAGDEFKTNHELLERVRNFEFVSRPQFARWQATGRARLDGLGTIAREALLKGLLREVPQQKEGHIASGPLVFASRTMLDWLKDGDRAYLAVEMESGAVMIAAHMDTSQTRALVIRGISDFGDERKTELDAIGAGMFRRYAMENATDLLWSMMSAGLFPRFASSGSG